MAKSEKDIKYFELDLEVCNIFLDPEDMEELTEEEHKEFLEDVGRAFEYCVIYYNNHFEEAPSPEGIKSRKAQRLYKSFIDSINEAITKYSIYLERRSEKGAAENGEG